MLKNHENTDENKLLRKLASGDEMAFEILFYRYRGKLGNFIKRSLPPQTDLEETVHEIFLRVWESRHFIDHERPFAPYLFRIARNLVTDELRKNIGHQLYLSDTAFINDFGINSTERIIEETELQNWFMALLDKLPEKRREIFEMHRLEGLSYKEIATKMNISENTVDTQIRRTLKLFREEIKKLKLLFFIFF